MVDWSSTCLLKNAVLLKDGIAISEESVPKLAHDRALSPSNDIFGYPPCLLHTLVPTFHNGHNAGEQLLILIIDLSLPGPLDLIIDFVHVSKLPGSALIY
jgi:hypothetical protein